MKTTILILIICSTMFFSIDIGESKEQIDPSKGLVLSNDYVRFEFEPVGMGLSAMIDLKSGFNHINQVNGKHLLWEISFGVGKQIYSVNNNFKPCNFASIDNLPDGAQLIVMEWNELRWWEEDSLVTVRVTIDLPKNDGVAQWRIFVENLSNYWGIWSVQFPMVNGFPASEKYDIARPTFASGGHLFKQWGSDIRGQYPSGGWPMQFMAVSQGKNSVYCASMDPEARAKEFVVDAVKNSKATTYPILAAGYRAFPYIPVPAEKMFMIHYPDNMGNAGNDYPDYYPIAFGVYQGNWVDAAHRYRPWALQQKWSWQGPVSQRTDIAEMVKNIGLWASDSWVWNGAEGTPHEMNVPFLDAQKRMGVPMGFHWYNWHHMTFDNQYPYFLPAKQGFKERVKELVDSGFLIMPYINGVSVDMNVPNFDKFAPHAIIDEAGGFMQHYYWDGAGRLLSMCPSQEFWQDAISLLCDSLLGYYGVNGVYIDQISAMPFELCFNKNHGHSLGGGHHWADGYRDLLRKVRNTAHKKGRQFVITSEGADEIFFDLLDANLTWAQPSDWEIPMMEIVYSGYTIFFGSRCDLSRGDRFFNFAQGQAFIDGRQNGWMGFTLFKPEHAAKAEFFRKCGQYRIAGQKFLNYGRLLQPVIPENDIPTFKTGGFGWPPQYAVYGWGTEREGTVPSAEARLWQAEDGNLGIFFANYVNEEIPFAYSIDPLKYGLKAGNFQLTEITPQGTISIGNANGLINRTEQLSPNKIKVIEIIPMK